MPHIDPASKPREAPPFRVLIVGCGRMASALLAQWHRLSNFRFTAVSPSGQRFVPEGVELVTRASEVEDGAFDILAVGVKPQMVPDVLPEYTAKLKSGGMLLSMAAGVSCENLQVYKADAEVVRIMPNLPVALGVGVSGLFADGSTTEGTRALADSLMAPTGRTLWATSEDQLDRITAVAGSGPGFAFEIVRCWSEAARELGFSEKESRELVLGTLGGAVALATEKGSAPAELRDEVTSKNGTTQAGLEALNGDARLDDAFRRTVQATYARAQELR